jgi:hypothetical protein
MEPVIDRIPGAFELEGMLRGRCYDMIGEIQNLAGASELDTIVGGLEGEQLEAVLVQLEAATNALEAIRRP